LPKTSGSEADQNFFRYGVALLIVIVIFCIIIISVLMWQDSRYNRIFVSGIDKSNYNTIEDVTHKVFFDIQADEYTLGRIIIGLFGNKTPSTVRNFVELCSGVNGRSKFSNTTLSY